MPIYTTTFPQDFWEHNFQQGGPWPPIAYAQCTYEPDGQSTETPLLFNFTRNVKK